MTVQMCPAAPQLLLMVTALVTISGAIWIALRAVRRRPYRRQLVMLAALLALYAAAWLGFALHSAPVALAGGDTKCFDDWCASFLAARVLPDQTIEISVRLSNAGTSPQKSKLARAFIVAEQTRRWPRDPDALQRTVPGNGSIDIVLAFDAPTSPDARFVISEGDSGSFTPAFLVIDDEASPWHALTTWSLAREP